MNDLSHLCDVHGLFLTRDALIAGYDARTLRRGLKAGAIRRVRHGAYTTGPHWDSLDEGGHHLLQACAAVRAAKTTVVLSHATSVLTHTDGWWDLPLGEVDLSRVDHRSGRREAGIRQHPGLLLPGDREPYRGEVERTRAARAAVELSTLVDFERALIVWNSMMHEGIVTRRQLHHASVDVYGHPGTITNHVLLAECDGRIESVGETRTYCLLRRSPLPRPHPQFPILGRGGVEIARLDFAFPELRVWIEFDGLVKYQKLLRQGESATDVVLRERDRERLIESLTGWICVRIDWRDLGHPERVIQRVLSAAAQAAQRRTA